jgi:hypothetical protein
MKLSNIFVHLLLLSSLSVALSASEQQVSTGQKSIRVEIDYGGLRPSRIITTDFTAGMSALKLLQKVAEVRTYELGSFVFVKSIDQIESKRGEMGWFYSINGVSAKRLASSYLLDDAEEMRWSYRVEACY